MDDLTTIAGETFDERDLEALRLAGELAERAGLPEPVIPPDSSLTPSPVDIAALGSEARRLADRGVRELFGMPLDRLVDNLKISGEVLDQTDLDALVIAGRLAEEIDRKEAHGE